MQPCSEDFARLDLAELIRMNQLVRRGAGAGAFQAWFDELNPRLASVDPVRKELVMFRWMLLACAVLLASPASAQGQEKSPIAEPRVSVKLKDVPLRAALEAIFRNTSYNYAVEPDVPDLIISIEITDTPLHQAVWRLIREGRKQEPGLTFSKG